MILRFKEKETAIQARERELDELKDRKDKLISKLYMKKLEDARLVHEAAKRDVENYAAALATARGTYETTNASYVEKMNKVSTTYSSYKDLEFVYEKAYGVWEYANTPYLKENRSDAGDIATGRIPGGTNPPERSEPIIKI